MPRWRLIAYVSAALVMMPLLVLVLSWQSVDPAIWGHLLQTQMLRLITNTLILVLGVGVGVIALGVSLAWLTSLCDFPGRRLFDWALMLPFAIPAYVLAFVSVGLFDFSGPFQTLLRDWLGNDFRLFFSIRSTTGVVLVLTLVFYPYVYMLARGAFLAQGKGLMEASRILGHTPWQGFWRVAIPMARPAIGAGAALAIMETLADFGAVSVFNYDTFTTAIYKTWYGFFSLQSATQLASLLLLFVFMALFLERRAQGSRRFPGVDRPRQGALYHLKGYRAWLATGFCLLVLALAFVIPVGQLIYWLVNSGIHDLDSRYWGVIRNTLMLGAMAAVMTVTLATLVVLARRLQPIRRVRSAVALANLGYALPGSVLAVGIMFAFSFLDNRLIIPVSHALGVENPSQLLLGSVFALLLAYLIRFMAVAHGPLDTSLARIRPSLPEAAQSLGQTGWAVFWRVYLPLLLPGALSAALLVFVDVLKEMPATLLMRPFGWDTLAVRIYGLTAEGDWQRASLPALTLVLAGLLPVIVLIRRSGRR
ncbi:MULTISPECIES: iron ABC transporter permease [Pseudomonas]|uniref:ABC transporter permease n=1 Tax=Pseudomonas TaxID=286 RepID=UPI0012393775|nr:MULTISPECIES: iron ABC transporter permease [Pseudomonas]QIB53048.1 iron ABC transporter permease [Pseudomonas sp. OIL-1]